MADRLRAEGVDCHRRGKDRRAREESGELRTELATRPGPRFFRSSDKPNDLILLAEYEDAARARQLSQSAEFGGATQRAGVTAPPKVMMADQVDQVPAELVHASVWFERYIAPNPAPTAQDHVLAAEQVDGADLASCGVAVSV